MDFLASLFHKFTTSKKGEIVICYAPLCNQKVIVSYDDAVKSKVDNDGKVIGFCPEHLERLTSGRVSDNDPNTNSDLNK